MRAVVALAAAVTVAGLLSACGESGAAEAGVTADRALERVESLERRVSEVEGSLDRAADRLASARALGSRVSKDLGSLSDRLDRAVARLRSKLSEVQGSASEAASSALAEAQGVARDLEVLEKRYDYHLRRYHGGG